MGIFSKKKNRNVKEVTREIFTFGAPLTVPTGNAALRASQLWRWSSNCPLTCKTFKYKTNSF
jgi:hypothetical protein